MLMTEDNAMRRTLSPRFGRRLGPRRAELPEVVLHVVFRSFRCRSGASYSAF
jgi:hypothetical protein